MLGPDSMTPEAGIARLSLVRMRIESERPTRVARPEQKDRHPKGS
jgi:hypothetical protein